MTCFERKSLVKVKAKTSRVRCQKQAGARLNNFRKLYILELSSRRAFKDLG